MWIKCGVLTNQYTQITPADKLYTPACVALSLDQEGFIKYLVPIQMHDIHLKANQGLHQGDCDIGVQVVSSAFKHRMSKSKRIPPIKCVTELKLKKKKNCHSYFNTLIRKRRSPGSPSMWGSPVVYTDTF